MLTISMTPVFKDWLDDLRDRRAAERIAQRLVRLESGLMGDCRFFKGIGEVNIDYGPGYRLYFVQRGRTVVILLCGGDKSTQWKDIRNALVLAGEV